MDFFDLTDTQTEQIYQAIGQLIAEAILDVAQMTSA